jgi:hypothetical protein
MNDCNEALEGKKVESDEYELAQVLLEVTRSKGKQISSPAIGYWLRKNQNKVQDSLKITKDPRSPRNRAEWILTSA